MIKLIKISDTHYIVVDDSEVKEGDKFYCITNKVIFTAHTIEYLEEYNKLEDSNHNFYVNSKYAQKITHSTQPLEKIEGHPVKGGELWTFDKIKPLSLSEVEEAIYGYSIEKMSTSKYLIQKHISDLTGYQSLKRSGYIEGFKAHQELVKDKFLGNDKRSLDDFLLNSIKYSQEDREIIMEALSDYLEPTEWNIEFDEQGKIKLI